MKKIRKTSTEIIDTITFPLRAFTMFEQGKLGLSSLRSERFDYVSREIDGYNLDIGCGRQNYFTKKILNDNGIGIDVFKYEGLTDDNIVKDLTNLPYKDGSFDSVTFIANLNHVPKPLRDPELKEAYRVLKTDGKIVVTMGSPIAELTVHKVVYVYDKVLGTNVDMDTERGMDKDEDYYLTADEIIERLKNAGFKSIKRKRFLSQWGLNSLYVGIK